MRQQMAALVALAAACMFVAGCTSTVDGNAVAADMSRPPIQARISVSALDGLLLDVSQVSSELGATSMKVWYRAKAMWDWSQNVADKNCLAADGPAQDTVYAGSGWTAVRDQRLDDSVDDSKNRQHYAIQAVVAFPTAHDASAFYNTSVQSWKNCSNRRFDDVAPGEPTTVGTVTDVVAENGTLRASQLQEGGDGWSCQRALTVRNNVSIDVATCSYSQKGAAAVHIAEQIAAKAARHRPDLADHPVAGVPQ
ncbi:MAG: sensor domain-containing protein [Mycobacterium pseudokansasii]|uniref:sensor domain-containing protein n=1 Tax=Mycobacterium pseudokansasii TaxID=2341080 RepID=UPI0023F3D905|nr:sensor domain-containing protein [Mycobacterium pseudokansasii]MBY0386949.1 sensor domain-containing protein [Mycobacterium pseudokansasii]